jgi:hypothetical protein
MSNLFSTGHPLCKNFENLKIKISDLKMSERCGIKSKTRNIPEKAGVIQEANIKQTNKYSRYPTEIKMSLYRNK